MMSAVQRAKKDGVVAIWDGKGPRVDGSGEPFKHGNFAGTHPNGGVLIVAGDDHIGKSSPVSHQSELALMHSGMPIFSPSYVQDVIHLALLGFAMSLYPGLFPCFNLSYFSFYLSITVFFYFFSYSPLFLFLFPSSSL